jgi:hypothetical protein
MFMREDGWEHTRFLTSKYLNNEGVIDGIRFELILTRASRRRHKKNEMPENTIKIGLKWVSKERPHFPKEIR